MFDIFKFAGLVKGTKVTKVKVHGATMPLTGLPESFTPEGLSDLAESQETLVPVSLPKVEVCPEVFGQGKITIDPKDAGRLIRREYPEAEKAKVKKTKKGEEERGGIDPALNGETAKAS